MRQNGPRSIKVIAVVRLETFAFLCNRCRIFFHRQLFSTFQSRSSSPNGRLLLFQRRTDRSLHAFVLLLSSPRTTKVLDKSVRNRAGWLSLEMTISSGDECVRKVAPIASSVPESFSRLEEAHPAGLDEPVEASEASAGPRGRPTAQRRVGERRRVSRVSEDGRAGGQATSAESS